LPLVLMLKIGGVGGMRLAVRPWMTTQLFLGRIAPLPEGKVF
jgi:hypothetical protein